MKEQFKVTVKSSYTRAINLERDVDSISIIENYIPTVQAIKVLQQVVKSAGKSKSPKSWSIVGPYGSGKSIFSVFLTNLLNAGDTEQSKSAIKILKSHNKELGNEYHNLCKGNRGYLKITITGSPESLAQRFCKAIAKSVEKNSEIRDIKEFKEVVNKASELLINSISHKELIELLNLLKINLLKYKYLGVLIIIDELGKFLEYESRHAEVNDIYLLQLIAEDSYTSINGQTIILVLLHQAFNLYAKGLKESQKKEWIKIQGRYEEIAFLESSEQILKIISEIIETKIEGQAKQKIRKEIKSHLDVLIQDKSVSDLIKDELSIDLFEKCYPLHPISALILPHICQKFAQNERTLFTYLSSQEDFAFQKTTERSTKKHKFIFPCELYDYFINSTTSLQSDYITQRRWAEIVSAISRLGDAQENEINLLKTIGLLNLIGGAKGIRASKEILQISSFGNDFEIALDSLIDKSLITFRKFSNEYRVWQGSDFDIENSVINEMGKIDDSEVFKILNNENVLQPIVARRFSIESCSLRYFSPIFVNNESFLKLKKAHNPRLIVLILNEEDEFESYLNIGDGIIGNLDVLCILKNNTELVNSTIEAHSLKRIRDTTQEIATDPVAKKEIELRLNAATSLRNSLINNITESPKNTVWIYEGIILNISSKRSLQEELSKILEDVYYACPYIYNEIINRDKLSTQAVIARNKLLQSMLRSEEKYDLGISGYPPEKAIYRAVFLATGIHQEEAINKFKFDAPDPKINSFKKMNLVWNEIIKFLEYTERDPKSLIDLNPILMAPPFGIKAGLLPLLYIGAYLANKNEIAVYHNNKYIESFNDEKIERFVKRPDEFKFQKYKISGINSKIYEQYQEALFLKPEKKTVLELVKPLASFLSSIPKYTKNSELLSIESKRLIKSFDNAISPDTFLFKDLPKALSINLEDENSSKELSAKLREALREIKYAHDNLILQQIKLVASAFDLSSELEIKRLREELSWVKDIKKYVVKSDEIIGFINRIIDFNQSDQDWSEGVLSYLGQLATLDWLEENRINAELRLNDYSRRILDLRKILVKSNSNSQLENENYLIKTLGPGGQETEKIFSVKQVDKKVVSSLTKRIKDILSDCKDENIKAAVISESIKELFKNKRNFDEHGKFKFEI